MKTILIIEDERTLLNGLLTVLELENYEAIGAENGRLGLQYARDRVPDLILCDVSMPELDGFQMLAELRRDPRTAAIPLVFLSAKTEEANVQHGLQMGAADYIIKPFAVEDLLARIGALLNR